MVRHPVTIELVESIIVYALIWMAENFKEHFMLQMWTIHMTHRCKRLSSKYIPPKNVEKTAIKIVWFVPLSYKLFKFSFFRFTY